MVRSSSRQLRCLCSNSGQAWQIRTSCKSLPGVKQDIFFDSFVNSLTGGGVMWLVRISFDSGGCHVICEITFWCLIIVYITVENGVKQQLQQHIDILWILSRLLVHVDNAPKASNMNWLEVHELILNMAFAFLALRVSVFVIARPLPVNVLSIYWTTMPLPVAPRAVDMLSRSLPVAPMSIMETSPGIYLFPLWLLPVYKYHA